MARKHVRIGDFVDTLVSFEKDPITRDRVLGYLQEVEVDRGSLDNFVHFRPDMYTRNLVHRDEQFEIMAVCWSPGQRTVIHSHNGQLGWMSVEQGALAAINYKWLGCNAPQNQNVSGMDCIAGGGEIEMERRDVQESFPGGPINTVDKEQTIHQVVVQGKEPAISIHVYSRPIDSCVAYDLLNKTCYRRQLRYFSKYGDVVLPEGELAAVGNPISLVTAPRRNS